MRFASSLLPATLLLAASACGPSSDGHVPAAAQTVSIGVEPRSAELRAAATAQFAATVTGTADTTVLWTVVEASGGSVTAGGVYTAPSAAGVFHVRATSRAAPAVSAEAIVTVTAPPPPVVVTVTPSPASADACKTVTFTATVTGTTNGAVTWSVQEGAAGGAVTAGGVYTAPATAGTYHVVAASQADPSRTSVVAVTVSDRILGVAVSPPTISVAPGGTASFSATVTTTCGTTTSTSTVAATATGQLVVR